MDIKDIKKGNYIIHHGKPFLVKESSLDGTIVKVVLENIFDGEIIETELQNEIQEFDLTRRCGTIISKDKEHVEILDLINFENYTPKITKELFEEAEENDQVTYIRYKDQAKILEVRKH